MKLKFVGIVAMLASMGAFTLTLPVVAMAQSDTTEETDSSENGDSEPKPAIPLDQDPDC